MQPVASGRSLVGLAREAAAAFGWALPGFAGRPSTDCGVAQHRNGPEVRVPEVGTPTMVHHPNRNGRDTTMIRIIGIDPHKSSHTATAIDAARTRRLRHCVSTPHTLAIASCCDGPSGSTTSAGPSRTLAVSADIRHSGSTLAARSYSTFRVPRQPVGTALSTDTARSSTSSSRSAVTSPRRASSSRRRSRFTANRKRS